MEAYLANPSSTYLDLKLDQTFNDPDLVVLP
jgi:hypothetical protein